MNRINLNTYDIDATRGFLPAEDPLEQLPPAFDAWERLAAHVSTLLMTQRLRPMIRQLPVLDAAQLEDDRQFQRAMLLLSVLGSAYVWADQPPATSIPRGLAVPWAQIAERLGRPMIIAHASMALTNWRRLDPTGSLDLDNLDTLQLFLGGLDEKWFYLTAIAIEAKGAPALPHLGEAQQIVAADGRADALARRLDHITDVLNDITAILERIPEQCDPYIFYHRVRPFLAGWQPPGMIYEGVSETPQLLAGGSAAQSALIQALDAGLGVTHESEQTSAFLREMRSYMPPAHRHYIEALEAGPSIRDAVRDRQSEAPGLVDAYNRCIQRLVDFRKKHLELSVRYILHQAPSGEAAKGTGGTSFVPFLSTARTETRRQLID